MGRWRPSCDEESGRSRAPGLREPASGRARGRALRARGLRRRRSPPAAAFQDPSRGGGTSSGPLPSGPGAGEGLAPFSNAVVLKSERGPGPEDPHAAPHPSAAAGGWATPRGTEARERGSPPRLAVAARGCRGGGVLGRARKAARGWGWPGHLPLPPAPPPHPGSPQAAGSEEGVVPRRPHCPKPRRSARSRGALKPAHLRRSLFKAAAGAAVT